MVELSWNATHLDGTVVTWCAEGQRVVGIVAVLDPESDRPARCIDATGDVLPFGEGAHGLTVYGTDEFSLPSLAQFRLLTPEYAHLADGIEGGHGRTEYNVRHRAGEVL